MSEFKGKTVLVTGATGLIGSNLVRHLMELGDVKVVAVGRNEDKLRGAFSEYLEKERFEILAFDVADGFPNIPYFVDYIFHAAGPMEGKIIQQTPINVIFPNIYGMVNCFEFLKRINEIYDKTGRLIVFSSVTVYSNRSKEDMTVTEEDTGITEKLGTVGAVYSQSKRMVEVIANAYIKQYQCDAVIARLSTVYGDTIYHPDTAFFQFIDTALSGETIAIKSSGIGRRDNIYVDDAVRGLLAIALYGMSGEAYNVSSDGELGNYAAIDEIAQIILDEVDSRRTENEKLNYKIEYIDGGLNPRRPGLRLDNKKLKNLGWTITTSINDGVAKTIDSIMLKRFDGGK